MNIARIPPINTEVYMPTNDDTTDNTSEAAIEQRLKDLGANKPRVTPERIDATIVREAYWDVPGTTVTVCALTLRNGYTVIGKSAAASPENFNAQIGRDIARREAREEIWALEGYLLRQRLSQMEQVGHVV